MSQARSSYDELESIPAVRKVRRLVAGMFSQSRDHLLATVAVAGGYGSNLAFQMVYFLLLTRMLGPDRFGHYVAAYAIVNLVSPFAGLGFSEVALVRVSEDKDRSLLWAVNALVVTTLMGLAVAIGLTSVTAMLASEKLLGWHLVFGLAISELVFVSGCRVMARVHQARQETMQYSVINGSIGAIKALIAFCLFLTGQGSLAMLILMFNFCYFPFLVLLFASLTRRASAGSNSWKNVRAHLGWADVKSNMRLAFSFATDLSCQTLSTNLDKLLLAFWYSPYVVGTYSAGYRLLFISAMPIRAVVEATFPHQVKLARNDRRASRYFTANIISLNLALSFAIAGLIFVLAPLATIVLGEDFRDSVGVLRLGAILPIAQGCNYTLGKYLTATNRQTVRTKVQIIVTATYVGVGLIVIPLHSWKGAIWMAIGSESLLAVLFGFACLVSPQRDITETEGGS